MQVMYMEADAGAAGLGPSSDSCTSRVPHLCSVIVLEDNDVLHLMGGGYGIYNVHALYHFAKNRIASRSGTVVQKQIINMVDEKL